MRTIRPSLQQHPQSTHHILMVRPGSFAFNDQTAPSNTFQSAGTGSAADIHRRALTEFDNMTEILRAAGVDVLVFEDTPDPPKPDAVFPNNWISFHHDGKVVLYPMMAENRRAERRRDVIGKLSESFHVEEIIDLSAYEKEGKFLEGTGSMVLDRMQRIAYACLSPRTHPEVLKVFGDRLGYEMVSFRAADSRGVPLYHTNVVMCIGDGFAVVCLDAVADADERQELRLSLENTGKYIVEISADQLNSFAGNMLLAENRQGQKLLVMSSGAYESLSLSQRDALDDFARLLPVELDTIESNGGGSARCMMAEIHLPGK